MPKHTVWECDGCPKQYRAVSGASYAHEVWTELPLIGSNITLCPECARVVMAFIQQMKRTGASPQVSSGARCVSVVNCTPIASA